MLWHTSLQIVKEFTEHPPELLPMSHPIPVQTGSSMFYVPLSPPPSSTTFMYSSVPHTVTSDEWGTRRPAPPPSIVSADLCTVCPLRGMCSTCTCVLHVHVLVSCYYPLRLPLPWVATCLPIFQINWRTLAKWGELIVSVVCLQHFLQPFSPHLTWKPTIIGCRLCPV